jgi:enterochelin esterase-like enzyme
MIRTKLSIIFVFALTTANSQAQLPAVVSGKLTRIENFASQYTGARNIDIWVPDGYTSKKKYAVLYMHDGQMLFDSTTTWNKQSWNVDDIVGKMLKEKKIRDVIVVGVWNLATRYTDYFPQKPFESLTQTQRDSAFSAKRTNGTNLLLNNKVHSDGYLRFLVTELKPYVDQNFSTKKDRANTFVAGSSMGGLISMYAICEYPEVFGGAACISTHWPGTFGVENNPIPDAFCNYLRNTLPDPKTHKIYFDCGTTTLDAFYPPLQKKVDAVMKEKGWTLKNWMTQEFPGEDHSEKAWRKRFHIPLEFLLKK